jgi:hypothetical protein
LETLGELTVKVDLKVRLLRVSDNRNGLPASVLPLYRMRKTPSKESYVTQLTQCLTKRSLTKGTRSWGKNNYFGLEVLTAVVLKSFKFWD